MAVHSGTAGSVVYGGTAGTIVGEIKSFTLDITGEELDTSSFGQSWRGYDLGVKEWGGSFTGNYDAADTYQTQLWTNFTTGAKAEVVFYVSATAGFRGTAIVSGDSVSDSFDGLAEVEFTFKGDGTLAKL